MTVYLKLFMFAKVLFRALALKALDQRLANTSSPVGSTSSNAASQAARPPSVTQSRSEGTSPPTTTTTTTNANGRAHDRKKSVGEADVGETITKSESR